MPDRKQSLRNDVLNAFDAYMDTYGSGEGLTLLEDMKQATEAEFGEFKTVEKDEAPEPYDRANSRWTEEWLRKFIHNEIINHKADSAGYLHQTIRR